MVRTNKNKPALVLLDAFLCWAIAFPNAAKAQEAQPLPVEDVLRVLSFGGFGWSSMSFSPDGKYLVYVVRDNSKAESLDAGAWIRTGIPFGVGGDHIYISNTETGERKNLTPGESENWLPTWSPGGEYVAFLSDRDGSGQAKLWVWNAATNELRKVCDVAMRADEIEWMSDGRDLLITALPSDLSAEDYVRKSKSVVSNGEPIIGKTLGPTVHLYKSRNKQETDKEAAQSDPWSLNGRLRELVLVNVESGKTKALVRGQKIAKILASPDGSRVAYTIPKRFETQGSQQILFDLAVVDIQTSHETILASDVRLDYDGAEFGWSPNGMLISYHTGGPGNPLRDCYLVDARGGVPRNITKLTPLTQPPEHKASVPLWDAKSNVFFIEDGALWEATVENGNAEKVAEIPNRQIIALIPRAGQRLWTSDNGKSTVVVTHDDTGKQNGFYKIDLESGRGRRLLERGQCYACVNLDPQFATTTDGQHIAYFAEDAQHDPDIWISGPGFENPGRLTRLNPQFDMVKMGAARLIDWSSDDGERLQGALLLPAGYQVGERYPLVVFVYGGISLSNNFDRFGLGLGGPFNMQLLATRGYAVLLPDAPQRLGTPMIDLAKTVLPGVTKVIEMGIADPDRLGVMGHSYGGYSTLSLIVQTRRFKAAMEADGYADNVANFGAMNEDGSTFGTAIEEQGQGLMGGTPWQFRERYIENSPLFYLDRVETPLMIVHGANDTSVAPFLGDEIFVGLRRLGKVAEYARYEGEGHSPSYWSYANQVDYCNRLVAWFDQYLRPGER